MKRNNLYSGLGTPSTGWWSPIVGIPSFPFTWRHLVVKTLIYISELFIFATPVFIRHLWQLMTVVYLHWCLYVLFYYIFSKNNFLCLSKLFNLNFAYPKHFVRILFVRRCFCPKTCVINYNMLQLAYRTFRGIRTNWIRTK
jgi:hypothetical protein